MEYYEACKAKFNLEKAKISLQAKISLDKTLVKQNFPRQNNTVLKSTLTLSFNVNILTLVLAGWTQNLL